jgi:hypothetical protein
MYDLVMICSKLGFMRLALAIAQRPAAAVMAEPARFGRARESACAPRPKALHLRTASRCHAGSSSPAIQLKNALV